MRKILKCRTRAQKNIGRCKGQLICTWGIPSHSKSEKQRYIWVCKLKKKIVHFVACAPLAINLSQHQWQLCSPPMWYWSGGCRASAHSNTMQLSRQAQPQPETIPTLQNKTTFKLQVSWRKWDADGEDDTMVSCYLNQ
jgi:hypothetical protein